MANVQHNTIADADRHEAKGADSAASGTFLRANGDGTTTFAAVPYSGVSGTPNPTDYATSAQGTKADNAVAKDGSVPMTGPLKLAVYTLSTLPSAATFIQCFILVSNATAGPALCVSNGTNWIDIRTNATVA